MLLSVAVKNGLFHPNCQHTILQYIDGITKLPEPIDSKEDLKKYRLEQKQREMERTIRKLKRLKEGTFDSVTAEAYGKQLRDAQKKLREFINVVNEDYKNKILVRDSSREKVYNVKVDKIEKSGMIKVDKVIFGHENAPKKYLPNAVIDHINSEDKVSIRTFYDDNSMKLKDIHTTNHGNPKTHNYGINGEHAHDYEWNKDGILKNKTTRELTDLERKDNEDIL